MSKSNNTIEFRKQHKRYVKQYWEENHPEEKAELELQKQLREQQRLQGKIFDSSVRNWLDGEITAARIGLITTMVLTALIKGQIVIWVILYFAYRLRVKKATQEAIEADRRHDC